MVEDGDERDEEDDGRKDADEEPCQLGDGRGGQKGDAVLGEAEQLAGQLRDEGEDGVSGAGAQHEDGNDELCQHADNDCSVARFTS